MRVRGELLVTETKALKRAVAQELLYQEDSISPEELFEKGKKILDEDQSHRGGDTSDHNGGGDQTCP